MASSSYIPSLDGLRAISIALVFASHVGFGHVVPGGFGVTIFFFLSGYLITTLLTREWDRYGTIAQPAFYLRRIVRLGPPILLTICFSFLLLWLGLAEGAFDPMTVVSQLLFFYNYYSLHATASVTVDGLGILWSLAVEEHFYLIWPTLFILLAGGRHPIRYLAFLLLAVLAWRALRFWFLQSDAWMIYISTDTRFDSLLYGCLLAILVWRGTAERLFPTGFFARFFWLTLAVAVLIFCFLIRNETFRSIPRFSLQGLALMPVFFYAISRPDDLWFKPLNWRWVMVIGQWSFTIYLVHFVIIKALVFNGLGALGDPVVVVVATVLSLLYSAATYHWLEKPLHPLRRRLTGH